MWQQDRRSAFDDTCDICAELSEAPGSHFAQLYDQVLSTRILKRCGDVVVLPAIGQLLPGWLMLATASHADRWSDAPRGSAKQCAAMVRELDDASKESATPLAFEHGARSSSGRACGVYHAHLHYVPVRHEVHITELLDQSPAKVASFEAGLEAASGMHEYLLVRDSSNAWFLLDATTLRLPSQYMRRRLREVLDLESPWDWRAYGAEDTLIRLVRESI